MAVIPRIAVVTLALTAVAAAQQRPPIPSVPLTFGGFSGQFRADGTFAINGQGWLPMNGTWKADAGVVELVLSPPVANCNGAGRYKFEVAGTHVTFQLVADDCMPRRMILDRSSWRPTTEPEVIPPRRLVRTAADSLPPLAAATSAAGSWPSFRGADAAGVADGQNLPDRWDVNTGKNILWRRPIPGLAHSSPVVWGDRVYVTSAISSMANATFKPGLYGDGDASDDRSSHRWMIYAIDRATGRIAWERVATEGPPLNKRHIKSTYASASPATDGRIVVAWFGSQGVYAYDADGTFRWKVDLGPVDMGAYDIPTFEWGPASSPIIWNDLVIVQCDTQADSFVVALDAATGQTVWKTDRDELPSWGTPTVLDTDRGPELVTNGSNYIRAYDPRTGKERWRLGRSSKITAPTPILADGLIVVASGRGPERPVFVVRPGATGDITPSEGETTSAGVVWSKTGRGSYMPTPLAYRGVLYVLANNGLFDAYDPASGKEIYRQRLAHLGSGFSASPIAADGKIYIAGEDGEILVVPANAGPGGEGGLKPLAVNSMGEPLMATPALSRGVMFVRTASALVAIGQQADRQANPDFSGSWRLDPTQTTIVGGPIRVGSVRPPASVIAPIKIKHVAPTYPADAQFGRVQGLVVIDAVINRDGNVADAEIIQSIPGLDQAALTAVKQWKFTPATVGGLPVVCMMTVTVNFSLGSAPATTPGGTFPSVAGRSGGGGANARGVGPAPLAFKISQDATTMTVATTRGDRQETVTYRLDGAESRNVFSQGNQAVYVSRWENGRLVTAILPVAAEATKRVESRWLDADRMIVETTAFFPGSEPAVTRQVFVRVQSSK